jgi:hypothetical protein
MRRHVVHTLLAAAAVAAGACAARAPGPPLERPPGATVALAPAGAGVAASEADRGGALEGHAPAPEAARADAGDVADERGSGAPLDVAASAAAVDGPLRYPLGAVHSPVTERVAARMREILASRGERRLDVFMKAGASETADRRYLRCFWGDPRSIWQIDLGEREDLRATLEQLQGGRAGRESPFLRDSVAVRVGHSAGWAASGSPPPVVAEARATEAAWALVAFGTNDLSRTAPAAALQTYFRRLHRLLAALEGEGVAPIVVGNGPRNDAKVARAWAPAYSLAARAVAEERQVPFVDLIAATSTLPGRGLVKDGVHGTGWVHETAGPQPCVLTAEGLQHHYNVRNLVSLEALDRARRALAGDSAPLGPAPLRPVAGEGGRAAPYEVDAVPFLHRGTTRGGERPVEDYEGCAPDASPSGPERLYRLVLEGPAALRVVVVSAEDVDVDLRVVAGSAGGPCRASDTRAVEGTFEAGAWTLAVVTFVDRGGRESPGDYALIVTPCAADDDACRGRLAAAEDGGGGDEDTSRSADGS